MACHMSFRPVGLVSFPSYAGFSHPSSTPLPPFFPHSAAFAAPQLPSSPWNGPLTDGSLGGSAAGTSGGLGYSLGGPASASAPPTGRPGHFRSPSMNEYLLRPSTSTNNLKGVRRDARGCERVPSKLKPSP